MAGEPRAAPRLSRFAPAAFSNAEQQRESPDQAFTCPAEGQRHSITAGGSVEAAEPPGRTAQGAASAAVAACGTHAGRLHNSVMPAAGAARQRGWALQGGRGGGVPGRAQRTPQAPWRTLEALSLAATAGSAAGLPAAPVPPAPASAGSPTPHAAAGLARSLTQRAHAGGKENAAPAAAAALDPSRAAPRCPQQRDVAAAAPAAPREQVQQLAERLRAVRDRQGGRRGAPDPGSGPATSTSAPCAPPVACLGALCPSARSTAAVAACPRPPHRSLQTGCDPALPRSGPAVAASSAGSMPAGSSTCMAEPASGAEPPDAGASSASCRGSGGGHAELPLTRPRPDAEPAGASTGSAAAVGLFCGLRAAVDPHLPADASVRHATKLSGLALLSTSVWKEPQPHVAPHSPSAPTIFRPAKEKSVMAAPLHL